MDENESAEKYLIEKDTLIDNLSAAMTKKEERIKELESKIPEILGLKTQKKKMTDEIANLRVEKDNNMNEIATLKSTLNEMKTTLEDKEKELLEKSSRMSSENKKINEIMDALNKDISSHKEK